MAHNPCSTHPPHPVVFGVEADKWVSMRGAGLHLERSSQRSADKAPSLTKEWWWPFGNCSRTREKRATELDVTRRGGGGAGRGS